jgi:hypothetical protein
MFCYLWADKRTKEPYILFVEGKNLHHPALEAGTHARMKIFRVSAEEALPMAALENILGSAIALYIHGIISVKSIL